MTQFITWKQIMERWFADLREFIDYENPGSFLSRWDWDKLKALLGTELFELEWSFIKKIGFLIPEEKKKGGAVVKKVEAVVNKMKEKSHESVEWFVKKIAELEKEIEWLKNENNSIDNGWERDVEKFESQIEKLEKQLEEKSAWSFDIDNYQTIAMKDWKWLTVLELVTEYMQEVRLRKNAEAALKVTTEKFDSELKKQVGEIMKKNEYLQEDIIKMEKEVSDYKQEPAKARRYFYKFKVAYDMMIEAGAKDVDRKAVEKEVSKFEDEKIKQQIDSWLQETTIDIENEIE